MTLKFVEIVREKCVPALYLAPNQKHSKQVSHPITFYKKTSNASFSNKRYKLKYVSLSLIDIGDMREHTTNLIHKI